MNKKYLIPITLVMVFQVLLFQNCSKKMNFSGPGSTTNISGDPDPVCTTTFTEETGPVRILFLVDTSGSNFSDNPEGTDPSKYWRSSVMSHFLSTYANKTNFSYNITTFSNDHANSLVNITSGGHTYYFSNDTSHGGIVEAAYNSFFSMQDTGNTPYDTAINKVKDLIQSDLSTSTDHAKYSVVMLSDGKPNPSRTIAQVTGYVQSVIDLAPEQISFNTIYYYISHEDSDAEDRLEAMADTGHGSFIIANSNDVLNIEDTIRIPHTDCH